MATFDGLAGRCRAPLDPEDLRALRRHLGDRCGAEPPNIAGRMAAFRRLMTEGEQRIGDWRTRGDGFEALDPGLRRGYSLCRKAMRTAYEASDPAAFHELRKRVKYHAYHLRLLQSARERPMKALSQEAGRLADLLGKDHDLSVLGAALSDAEHRGGAGDAARAVGASIHGLQIDLRRDAYVLGRRLFEEKPKEFLRRVETYWSAWRMWEIGSRLDAIANA